MPPADKDGTSDCYVKVWNPEGDKIVTRVVEDNLNPIFRETIELNYDYESRENAPPIVLDLFD